MPAENPQNPAEQLSVNDTADRYWATKRVLRWWQVEVSSFEEDFGRARPFLPNLLTGAYPSLRKRVDMIAEYIPQIETTLNELAQRLADNPKYQELLAREPEHRHPGIGNMKISLEVDKFAPVHVGNFIGGELCTEEQMGEVVEALTRYFIEHSKPFPDDFWPEK